MEKNKRCIDVFLLREWQEIESNNMKIQIRKCKGKNPAGNWNNQKDCDSLFIHPFQTCPNGCFDDSYEKHSFNINVFWYFFKPVLKSVSVAVFLGLVCWGLAIVGIDFISRFIGWY